MDASIIGPATLSITQAITSFHSFLPPFTEIRKQHPADNPSFAADVRMGEIASVTVSLGIGLICSSLTGSPIPAYTAFLICAILVVLYESTLRSNRPCEPKRSVINLAEVSHA
jgi:hypothetical protein